MAIEENQPEKPPNPGSADCRNPGKNGNEPATKAKADKAQPWKANWVPQPELVGVVEYVGKKGEEIIVDGGSNDGIAIVTMSDGSPMFRPDIVGTLKGDTSSTEA